MLLILRVIYICLVISTITFALIKKKNLSFLVVYLLSSILFYFNAISGDIYVGKLNQIGVGYYPIYYGSYIVLIANLIVTWFFLFIEPEKEDYRLKTSLKSEDLVMKIFVVAVILLSAYMCIRFNVTNRSSFDKHELADDSGSLGTYYKYLASFTFVYVFSFDDHKVSWFWKIAGSIPIFSTFLFGNRSYLVISLVAVLFEMIYKECRTHAGGLASYLARHKVIVISASILLFVTLVIKGVTNALFSGKIELVVSRLTSIDYYKQVFFVSEPNSIMTNLNTIVSNHYQIEPSSLIALWAYFVPFVTRSIEQFFGVENFAKVYQRVLYVNQTNRAGSYLGEAYANGGYIMVPVIAAAFIVFLILIAFAYKRCTSHISKTAFLLIGIDAAFFIQRNSLSFALSRFRDYIYILIILIIMNVILSHDHKIRI